jgi:hypothetical protein
VDRPLGAVGCERDQDVPLAFAPDGRSALVRRNEQFVLERMDGSSVPVGPAAPLRHAPPGFMFSPSFSPDSQRLLLCSFPDKRHRLALVIDAGSGRVVSRHAGTCAVAFTSQGLAVLRAGRVTLNGKTVFTRHSLARRVSVPLVLSGERFGRRLLVESRDLNGRKRSDIVRLTVVSLAGHIVGSYHHRIRIPFSPIELSPRGTSAAVWWGCIMQLARFDRASHTFSLHFGEAGTPVLRPSYSPTQTYVLEPQIDVAVGGEQPRKVDALVLAGNTLKPRYRLPISAQLAAWLPQSSS